MIVQTYQSQQVLDILKQGKIYRAKPSISFKGEYAALIDILKLKCECPVFGVVKGKKQNTSGKVSSSVKITLDVPNKYVKLTEFSVWADFMEAYRYSSAYSYKSISPGSSEITQREYTEIIKNLETQRPLKSYKYPQVILEKINPEWMKSYKKVIRKSERSQRKAEDFFNLFRK